MQSVQCLSTSVNVTVHFSCNVACDVWVCLVQHVYSVTSKQSQVVFCMYLACASLFELVACLRGCVQPLGCGM